MYKIAAAAAACLTLVAGAAPAGAAPENRPGTARQRKDWTAGAEMKIKTK
ncbi:hypothetical protein [Actinoplanes sp. NPDC005259]